MEIFFGGDRETLEKKFFAMAAQCLADEARETVILVPAQASFLVESQLMKRCHVAGFLQLEVLSFEKLTERLLSRCGGRAIPALDKAGLCMLAKEALNAKREELHVLDGKKDGELHVKVAELVSAMKMENISPEDLAGLAKGHPSEAKLLDIALLYREMQDRAGAEMMDARDLEAYAAALIEKGGYFAGKTVLVHGFDLFPERRMQTLVHIARAAEDMRITFEAEEENPVFEKQNANRRKLARLMEAAGIRVRETALPQDAGLPGEIVHVMENLYAYPYRQWKKEPENIEIVEAGDKQGEVEYIAGRILELACRQGLRMRDMEVLAGNPAAYSAPVRDIFAKAGIPFFMEEKRPLLVNALARFLLSAVDLFKGKQWRMFDALRHLKAGFLPLSQAETDRLCAYIREYGIRGSMLKKPLAKAPEEIEELRSRAFSPLLETEEQWRAGGEIAGLLLQYMENLGVRETLEKQAEETEAAGFAPEARYLSRVYEKTCELLEQTALFTRSMDMADFGDILESGLAGSEIAVVPPRVDEVVVGDIAHSIFPRKKVVFVLGANDGTLPAAGSSGGLINDYEMEKLKESQPNFPDKLSFDDQKSHIRRALYSGEKLVMCYNKADGMPSHLVHRLFRLFPEMKLHSAGEASPYTAAAGMESLAEELRRRSEGEKMEGSLIPAYIKENRGMLLELLPWVGYENRPAQLGKGVAAGLYGARKASVSSIEDFYRCPYKHFLDYGIRPTELREYEEDVQEAGLYVHDLMDKFARNLAKNHLDWAEVDDAQLKNIIDATAEEQRESHNRGVFTKKRYAFTEKRLREEAVMAAKAVRSQLHGTGVKIIASEKGFGFRDGMLLKTPGGTISLRGKIDRVDAAKIDGKTYLRVVDYKTGHKKFTPADAFYGLNIQLLVYLMAVESWCRTQGSAAIPAGGFYFSIDLPYIEPDQTEEDRFYLFRMNGFLLSEAAVAVGMDPAREGSLRSMNARLGTDKESGELIVKEGENSFSRTQLRELMEYTRELIARAAGDIYAGCLAMRPVCGGGDNACAYCAYHSICRFDEAHAANRRRWKEPLKKQEVLERIEREEARDDG